ncbi:MAG: hypothetical protein AAFV69_06155 [Pseudomonadota bacterium]
MTRLRSTFYMLCTAFVLAGVLAGYSQVEAKGKYAAIDGLAAMHDIRSERGKLCFTDHYHYGSSQNLPSKKMAVRAAIGSWQDFTDLEYGGRWSSYRYAASKKVGCKVESGAWGCEIEARPCAKR